MIRTCPDPEELLRLLDGEVTENRGAKLRAHVLECRRCGLELESQRQLVERLSAPIRGVPSPGAAESVVRRLDSTPAPAPARSPASRAWALGALGAAAAAAAVLAVGVLPRKANGPDGFRARGTAMAWARSVGVQFWAVEATPRSLAVGAAVKPGTALVASYQNLGAEPAHLLAFAVDARGDVHWLYPGFTEPGTDPAAIRLDTAAARRVLPESVVLEGAVPGPLRVVSVVSREPLRVSSIEALRPAERTLHALRSRWPAARIDELVLQIERPRP